MRMRRKITAAQHDGQQKTGPQPDPGAVGVEIPAGIVTITPRISYTGDVHSPSRTNRSWTRSVEANHWYSQASAIYTSIGRTDVRHSSYDSWNWEIGLRARFQAREPRDTVSCLHVVERAFLWPDRAAEPRAGLSHIKKAPPAA